MASAALGEVPKGFSLVASCSSLVTPGRMLGKNQLPPKEDQET